MTDPSTRPGRARTALAVVGAAAVLVSGLDAIAFAATGQSVVLGTTNRTSKTTTVQNTGNGPALKLRTKKSKPPLVVTSKKRVKRLNADLVDGKSLDQIEPATKAFSIGTAGETGTSAPQAFQTTTLPAGTYEFDLGGVVAAGAGDYNVCTILDATRYLASGGADTSALYIYWVGVDGIQQVHGHFVGEVLAGNRMMLVCEIDTTTTYFQPVQWTLKKLDRSGAIPNMAATSVPRTARGRFP